MSTEGTATVPEVSTGSEGDGVESRTVGRSSGQGEGTISSLMPGIVWCTRMAKLPDSSTHFPTSLVSISSMAWKNHTNCHMGVLQINLS